MLLREIQRENHRRRVLIGDVNKGRAIMTTESKCLVREGALAYGATFHVLPDYHNETPANTHQAETGLKEARS